MSNAGSIITYNSGGPATRKYQRHFTWSACNKPDSLLQQRERQRKLSQASSRSGTNLCSRSHSLMMGSHHLDYDHPLDRSHRGKSQKHQGPNYSNNTNYVDELIEMDDDDGNGRSLWGEFEEHIMSIDTDSVQFAVKPSTSKGSLSFKEAMGEEYRLKQAFTKTVGTAVRVNMFRDNISSAILREEDEEEGGEDDARSRSPDDGVNNSATIASRCWNKVKIDLQEQHLENKLSEETTGWNLVQRTKFNINNPSDIRQELYDKYLKQKKPCKWWLEGLHNYEKYKGFFEDDHSDSENHAYSAKRKKRVTLSGCCNTEERLSQGRMWSKAKGKRPLTSRSGYTECDPVGGGLKSVRPMTAMESVS